MKSVFWVVAAGVAVTASALAWRTTPKPLEAPLAVAPAPKTRPIRHRPADLSWSQVTAARPAAQNPSFRPLPAVPSASEPVLAQLPADTLFVAASDNAATFMDAIDLRGLLEQNASNLDELEKALGGMPGVDPLNPSTWNDSGIDFDGPAGFAFVDYDKPVLVMFAEISNRDTLDRSMDVIFAQHDNAKVARDVEGVQIVTEANDDGEPVDDPELAFVLRGNRVFVVARLESGSDVAARAEEIALQTAEGSLIEDPSVVSLVNALELGKDGVAYMNVRAMLAGGTRQFDREIAEAEADLERIRAEAQQSQTEPDTQWPERHMKELEGLRTFLDATIGGVRGVAFGLELGQQQVELEATVELEPGSVLTELISTRAGIGAIRMAIPTAPVFLLDGVMNPSVVRRLVQLGFTIADANYEQVMQIAKAFGGFEQDPFDLVSGEVGFALTKRQPGSGPDFMPVDGTMVVGLTNPVLAQKILDQIGGMATIAGWGKYVEKTKGLALEGMFSAQFAVVGRSFIFSTSGDIVTHFAEGGRDVSSELTNSSLAALLPAAGQSANWLMDASLFSIGDEAGRYADYDPWPITDADSAEVRSIKAQLRKLDYELYTKPQEWRAELSRRIATSLGAWGATATPDDVGLRIRAGWYFSEPNVAAVLASVSDSEMAKTDSYKTDEVLSAQRDALLARMNALQAPPPVPTNLDPTYQEYPNPGEVPPPELIINSDEMSVDVPSPLELDAPVLDEAGYPIGETPVDEPAIDEIQQVIDPGEATTLEPEPYMMREPANRVIR